MSNMSYEFRAVWTGPGGQCSVVGPTVQGVMKQVEGFSYPKPDLRIEQRTTITLPWKEVPVQ